MKRPAAQVAVASGVSQLTEQNPIRTTDLLGSPSLLDHLAVGVCTVNVDCECTHINHAALRMLDLSRDRAVGRAMHDVMHVVDNVHAHPPEQCPIRLAAVHGEELEDVDEVFVRPDGSKMYVRCSLTPTRTDTGAPNGAVLTLADLTSRRETEQRLRQIEREQREAIRQRDAAARVEQELTHQLVSEQAMRYRETSLTVERIAAEQLREHQRATEERLVQSEKLAAVGRLAASISHEINNPLEAVTNLLYLVRMDETLSEQSNDYLKQAESELSRASEIVSQTLRFQRGTAAIRQCAPEALIDSVVALHQGRLHNSGIRIQRQHRRSAPIPCAEGDLRQILNNLLTNALDAMQEQGGTLLIRTSASHDPVSGAPGIRVSVADSGSGMSPRTASKIFEPFYTTKGASGSGLGLWISWTLAQRNGGRMSVRSSNAEGPRRGTTFSIFLPEAPEAGTKQPETLQ